jgi:hypothetical protein
MRHFDSPLFRNSTSVVARESAGVGRPAYEAKPLVFPGGTTSEHAHRSAVLRHDPTTLQGWSESMRGPFLDHLRFPRVQKRYDDLLKVVDESGSQAGIWSKLHRWTPPPCTSAARRASFECRLWFFVNTMAIIKSCNVSTSVLAETVAEGRHPHDQVKQDRLVEQCLEAIRNRTSPIPNTHEIPENATTTTTASLWPRLLWFDGTSRRSLWPCARWFTGSIPGSLWSSVPWYIVTLFSIPPIWSILKGLTTRIEWLQGRTKVAFTLLGCVLITSPISDTVIACILAAVEAMIAKGLTSLGYDEYSVLTHAFMDRARLLLLTPSVLAFQFSGIVAGLQYAYEEVELVRENKQVVTDAILAASALSGLVVGSAAALCSTGICANAAIGIAVCVMLLQCFEFWTFPSFLQYDVGSATHLAVMAGCFCG